ncbi:MAG TPA: folylpolyglutamate synthase/dihydrofolate synthase family protein, partial [Candidatus Binatia bacterium]|nr:folylpolyglutamate synthase/dihydrofolate synthase family protein [Candidatus Binatia bacterium]
RLGSPEQTFPSLHIAGTNGKGSTAAIAHAVLSRHGLRVGLFTSPHLSDFRERVRVGNEWIPEARVVELVEEIRARLFEPAVPLTFFEVTTVLAFLHFARARVDAAVVEVGLGGRLDATNVLVPRATVVTTIGLDHERYLGTTVASIAAEKGGIFKPGVPAIVGRVEGDAESVLARIAAAQPCPYHLYGREFGAEIAADGFDYHGRRTIRDLRPALAGRFQIDNAAVALAALEEGGWLGGIADETIRAGVATVRWPGRLEVIRERPRMVLDGAHNPAGVAALVSELPRLAGGRPIHLVFGVLADKRWSEMVERLARAVADVAVVPVVERRSENPARVAGLFRRFVPTRIEQSATTAIERLLADPACAAHVILVAGSLFLVGEARRHFGPPTPA